MNETDRLAGARPEPKQLPRCVANIRDVAVAAGVSVTTVSNVINHPHLVATHTRERVELVIRGLGFQPNSHAKALRRLGSSIPGPSQDTVPDSDPDHYKDPVDAPLAPVADALSSSAVLYLDPEVLEPGKNISFRLGQEVISGLVEAVMPDKSYFWIWETGGRGRRMIDAKDVAAGGSETSE